MDIEDLNVIIKAFEIGKIYKMYSLKPKKQRLYKIEFSRKKSPMLVETELFNEHRLICLKTVAKRKEE